MVEGEPDEPVVPVVPFDACLAKFAASAMVPDYFSPALGGKGHADVTLRIATFPPYLMVHLQKCAPACRGCREPHTPAPQSRIAFLRAVFLSGACAAG